MSFFTKTWDGLPGSTLVASETKEKRYWGCFTELRGNLTEINWTDDGTTTGNTLFDASIMPWVEVMITAAGDLRDFTQEYYGGPMYQEDQSVNAFSWWTFLDPDTSSYWITTVARRGDPELKSAGTTESPGAVVFCSAVGDGG